jgi:hypothetical protein
MARLIFKCPYLRPGTAIRRGNYARYIATRDGVEFVNGGKENLAAMFAQKRLIERLLKDFPDTADSFEYEDYIQAPTRKNASEFITAALDASIAHIGNRSGYAEYIAKRPGAEKVGSHGSHGLFSADDAPVILSRAADEVSSHAGNIWLPIISLRREDAERLGYDSAERWRDLLRSQSAEFAAAMKIPSEHFRWYAAFHNEGHHPHAHMLCWSSEPGEGFLTKGGIRQIKSSLAARIFKDDLLHIYERQTMHRAELGEQSRRRMSELIAAMQNGELHSDEIERLIWRLSARLKKRKGKKQYGYLPASDKAIVDAIVDELCKDARVAECYKLWCEARMDILRTYTKNPQYPGELSKQPELKRIRNIVIEEAAAVNSELEIMGAELSETPQSSERDCARETGLGQSASADSSEFSGFSNEDSPRQDNGDYSKVRQEQRQAEPAEKQEEQQRQKQESTAAIQPDNSALQTPRSELSVAARLLHHLGKIFEDNPPIPKQGMTAERKLLRKLRQKKIAQGHAPDDYEQRQF